MRKKGYKHTEETKRKMGLSKRGRKFSKEHKKNLSISHLGIIPTKDVLEKRRKAMLGKKMPKRTREWRIQHSLFMKGRKLSKNTKDKLRKAMEGRIITWGDKISRAKKGFKFTKASKLKMSKSRKKYFKDNPEVIEIIKIHRAKQILPVKDTSIEVKIQNFLKELGVEYFTHKYIKEIEHGYQCDILIPSTNLVIECDGDYWHKYPVGTDIDHIRTSELLSKGFKVLRLWEREIKVMGLNDFKERLGVK